MSDGGFGRCPLELKNLLRPPASLTQSVTGLGEWLHTLPWSDPLPVSRSARVPPNESDPLPMRSGIYRLRFYYGEDLKQVVPAEVYIGQTKNLRDRMGQLPKEEMTEMPFTDPHIAGPAIYAWRHIAPDYHLFMSYLALEVSPYWRQGLEDLVVAYVRWKNKCTPLQGWWCDVYSPLAQFHAMPAGWQSSSERKVGRRGGPIPGFAGQLTPVDQKSIAPVGDLNDCRSWEDDGWGGHQWSTWSYAKDVPRLESRFQGLYKLMRPKSSRLHYIGYGKIGEAARKASYKEPDLLMSYAIGSWTAREQDELKTDALGLYLLQTLDLPTVQYKGENNPNAGSAWPREVVSGALFLKLGQQFALQRRQIRALRRTAPTPATQLLLCA